MPALFIEPDGGLSVAHPLDLSAEDLLSALDRRTIGVAELMAAFLERLQKTDPRLNAIVSLRSPDDLMAEARALDGAGRRGALSGLPFAVKDLVETAGIRTTHGSPLFADHVPVADDLLAARIRSAGAILVGKTNTPEFGLGSHSYNPVHGVTRNPYDLARAAGGSSGGAAAALAARLVPLADGSDMMGSLRNPAAFCNVYGFRPSWGLVPGDPVGDLYLNTYSTDGPMARTVRDLALLLDAIAGPDPRLPFSIAPPQGGFRAALTPDAKGRRIGWIGDADGHYAVEPEVLSLCRSALAELQALGAIIEPVQTRIPAEELWSAWLTLRSFAVASGLREHYDDPVRRRLLKPEAIFEIERGLAVTADELRAASLARSRWFGAAAALFDRFDALAMPAAAVFPFDADLAWPRTVAGRAMTTYHQWMEVVIPATLAGLPALSVPAGFGDEGLPAGLQLIGRRGADLPLLRLAEAYHQATDWPSRRPPRL